MAGVLSGAKRVAARLRAFAVVVIVSLSSPAALAQAYDRGDCQRSFPAGVVLPDVDTLRIDTGNYYQVDFGDDLHLGGAPQGTAVICWQEGRNRVVVIGKLYFDPRDSNSSGCAKIVMDFYCRDGTRVFTATSPQFCNASGSLQWREIRELVSDHDLHAVRIRLFGGRGTELAHTVTRKYGD